MKNSSGIFVIFLCIVFIFAAGCTQTTKSVPTPVPTTVIPTTVVTPKITEIPTITPNVTTISTMIAIINATPKGIADPTDVSQIQFKHYSDNDFSLDYPTSWNVSNSTFILYNCDSVEANRCYQTETKTIGPFVFSEDNDLKKAVRIVTFTSADSTQKIVAFISDFLDGKNGNFILNPDLNWAHQRVTNIYPDIGAYAVGDYHYFKSGNTMSSIFTMTAPASSAEYPLAYTQETFVTIHHLSEFVLISDNENIQKYYNLNNYIFKSIITADTP